MRHVEIGDMEVKEWGQTADYVGLATRMGSYGGVSAQMAEFFNGPHLSYLDGGVRVLLAMIFLFLAGLHRRYYLP